MGYELYYFLQQRRHHLYILSEQQGMENNENRSKRNSGNYIIEFRLGNMKMSQNLRPVLASTSPLLV